MSVCGDCKYRPLSESCFPCSKCYGAGNRWEPEDKENPMSRPTDKEAWIGIKDLINDAIDTARKEGYEQGKADAYRERERGYDDN